MSEIPRCPLLEGNVYHQDQIPSDCRETCDDLWTDAVNSPLTEKYDLYQTSPDDPEHGCMAGTEFSDETLQATSKYGRMYVTVDQCIQHGAQTGEQAYTFRCPLPLTDA